MKNEFMISFLIIILSMLAMLVVHETTHVFQEKQRGVSLKDIDTCYLGVPKERNTLGWISVYYSEDSPEPIDVTDKDEISASLIGAFAGILLCFLMMMSYVKEDLKELQKCQK